MQRDLCRGTRKNGGTTSYAGPDFICERSQLNCDLKDKKQPQSQKRKTALSLHQRQSWLQRLMGDLRYLHIVIQDKRAQFRGRDPELTHEIQRKRVG